MKLYRFNTQSDLVQKFPDYNPKIPDKVHRFKNVEYFKAGTAIKRQNCLWHVAQFLKTFGLSLLVVASFGRKYRDLTSRAWKEFKIGSETIDLYVRKPFKGLRDLNIPVQELPEQVNKAIKETPEEKCEILLRDDVALVTRLKELLFLLRNNKDAKKTITDILSRLEFKRLDRLITSEQNFEWRDLLLLFSAYESVFPVTTQENIRKQVEVGLEKVIFFDPLLSKEEITSLIHLKLAENPQIYYAVESSPDFHSIMEEIFKYPLTDIPQSLLQHCLSVLSSRLKETKFNDVSSLKKTFQNSCERSDLNGIPSDILYFLIHVSNALEIPLSNLGMLSEDKTHALIKEWEDNQFKKDDLINAMGMIPNIQQRQEILGRIFLKLDEEEFIDYLNAKHTAPEIIYSNIVQGNQNLERDQCRDMLKNLFENVKKCPQGVLSKVAMVFSIRQAIYFLHLGNYQINDAAEVILLEVLKKDVKKVLKLIPEQHHISILVALFNNPEQKDVQHQFLRELAFQNRLESILHKKNIENFSKDNEGLNFVDLFKRLTDEELRKCVHHYAQNENKKLLLDFPWHTFLMKFSYQVFLSLKDPSLLEGKTIRKFLLGYDELAEHYPHQILQAFHGMILGLNSNLKEHEVKHTITNEQLESAVNFIDKIRIKYPNYKERIDQYFNEYFAGFCEEAWEEGFGLLNVVLAIKEHENPAHINLKWLYEINAYHLQFLFPYISLDQKKAILNVFFEKFREKNNTQSLKDYSLLLKAFEKSVPAEDFKKLELPYR